MTEQEMMEKLKEFDTPSITNVVATYPDNPLCLGLYEPWGQRWYTDQTIKCIYPELGRMAGYAVTVVYGAPDPYGYKRLTMADLVAAIGKSKKPVIIALKQDFPEELKSKVGLCGGNMTTTFKQAGAVGVVTDGPSRDVDEIRPMKFQYMMTGVTPGHGNMAIKAINVPVSICGMDVAPGEVIHMDENGACKFPPQYMEQIIKNVEQLVKNEEAQRQKVLATKNWEELYNLLAPKK